MNILRKIRLNKLKFYTIKIDEKDLFEFVDNNLLNLKIVDAEKFK